MTIFKDELPCHCFENQDCLCGQDEKTLRHYAYAGYDRPMIPEEREWCITEADSAGEGYFKREELEKMNDAELAKATLEAWNMYVNSIW